MEKPPIPVPEVDFSIRSISSSESNSIKSIFLASLLEVGSVLNKPSWSVTIISLSALVIMATIAESLSLSPNFSYSVATMSFSLITGTIS